MMADKEATMPEQLQQKLPDMYSTMSKEEIRFHGELEFVQALANPGYLYYLAQKEFLKRQDFVNYLSYLQYWKQREYAQYLQYPQCLFFLELLQKPAFRKELENPRYAQYIESQQILQWVYYTRNRASSLQDTENSPS